MEALTSIYTSWAEYLTTTGAGYYHSVLLDSAIIEYEISVLYCLEDSRAFQFFTLFPDIDYSEALHDDPILSPYI